jgi:DNA-binding NtrC family response regulator
MPPLRERGDDVLLLAEEFLGELNLAEGTAKTFTSGCRERLLAHNWPGNVRELRNVVHRAFILAREEVGTRCLPFRTLVDVGGEAPRVSKASGASSLVTRLGTSIADAERQLILATLDHVGGCKDKAAEALGISVKTIYNRLREYKTKLAAL